MGIGGLAYYGLGMSQESSIADQRMFWPEHVRQRVRGTYTYFAGGLALTAAGAVGIFSSGIASRMVMSSPWLFLGGTMLGTIGSMLATQAIPYENTVAKHLAWGAFGGRGAAWGAGRSATRRLT